MALAAVGGITWLVNELSKLLSILIFFLLVIIGAILLIKLFKFFFAFFVENGHQVRVKL